MNIEELRNYCLAKKGTSESLPFDENTLVFKLLDKMFALTSISEETPSVNLKCNPEKAIDLREKYNGIIPGYHMNKKHWNTVSLNEDVESSIIKELIDHSYKLVEEKLTKKQKETLSTL